MCARWRCISYHDGSVDEDHPERVLGEEAAAECRYLLRRPLVIVVRIISSSSSIIRWFHRAFYYNFCERHHLCKAALFNQSNHVFKSLFLHTSLWKTAVIPPCCNWIAKRGCWDLRSRRSHGRKTYECLHTCVKQKHRNIGKIGT